MGETGKDEGADANQVAGADGIAADDAGGTALGRHVGETAGGRESFGVGSDGSAGAEDGSGPADVAADDAGVTAGLLRRPEHRGG